MRQSILAIADEGSLLSHLLTIRHEEMAQFSNILAELHNAGELDVLTTFESDQVEESDGSHGLHKLLDLFRRTLPLIHCDVPDALQAVHDINQRLKDAGIGATAHEALHEWLKERKDRPEEALSLTLSRTPINAHDLRTVLTAGAATDPPHFTNQALALAERSLAPVREAALFSLGRVVPLDDEALVTRTLERLSRAVDTASRDVDEVEAAINAALYLLGRAPGRLCPDIESIIVTASAKRNASVRSTLSFEILTQRALFTPNMVDAVFCALQYADATEHDTINNVDALLYEWDIDTDRERVGTLLQRLLTQGESPLPVSRLDSFCHKLKEAEGHLLGWYAFHLLSSGDHRLCEAAAELLPYKEARAGIDIDLSTATPAPEWIPYLARKVLGYCILKPECAAGLLLSCLRAVSDQHRKELEDLIFEYFLLNYLDAMQFFEEKCSGDQAGHSVRRLRQRLEAYVSDLKQLGTSRSFTPPERERRLQAYRHYDFIHDVQKRAERQSILSLVAHKSILLYGSASIARMVGPDGNAHRREMHFTEHQHVFQLPRLYMIDPVGLHFAINRFKSEPPPT